MALYLSYAVRSDLGLVRQNNEDSVYAGPRLLAIADGMGGHAAGEVASKIVISTMEHLDEDRRIDDLMGALRETVVDANQRIADAVKQDKELEGMGTTLTALRFVGSQVGMVHVGDSRAYMLRGDQLSQITHDDTYVQYLVDSGKLTPDEAKDHPRKSVILRALLGTEVEPDVSIREARADDRYLLCSDGLSDVVSAETIGETLRIEDPQEAADRLVELALRGGGPDNVTVIVADVLNARIGDTVNDVPIVAGAFVDPAAADVPGESSSPAERARALTVPPRTEQRPEPIEHRRRRRSWKPAIITLIVLIVVFGALGGVYVWTQSQYFVARADDDVAIYQGVNTEFGPLKFFNVYKVSDLRVSDLNAFGRGQVISGITASSENDAEQIVNNLRHQVLPLCHATPTPSPTSTVPVTPSTTPSTPQTTPRSTPKAPQSTPKSSAKSGTGAKGGGRSTGRPPKRVTQSPSKHSSGGHTKASGGQAKSGGHRDGQAADSPATGKRTGVSGHTMDATAGPGAGSAPSTPATGADGSTPDTASTSPTPGFTPTPDPTTSTVPDTTSQSTSASTECRTPH